MMRWRRLRDLAVGTADKALLAVAVWVWVFVLRNRTGVVDVVDVLSSVAGVYSVWRAVRSLVKRGWSGVRGGRPPGWGADREVTSPARDSTSE